MALLKSRADVTSLGDADLIARARDGHTDAFAELWRRHSRAGVTVARSYTSSFDPEDLVAEAFAKIFQIVRNGGGPQGAFRPYLFTTIRNTAASWGRSRNETPIEDADQIEDVNFSEENTLAALDRSLTAKAFRSLPTRWQEALWYSEVESMTPQEIAPLLGMKANAVAALTYRAREGLRQAWIQAHLLSVPEDSEHRWTIDHLGGYARHTLGKRDTARIDEHLEECAKCSIVAAEAQDVGSRLALVLLPIAAGVAGATGYAAWMQTAAHGTAYAMGATGLAMPAAAIGAPVSTGAAGGAGFATGGAGGAGTGAAGTGAAAGGASAAGVSGVVVGSVVTGVLVVAGVTAAIALGPTIFGQKPAANPPAAEGSGGGSAQSGSGSSGQSDLDAPSLPAPSPSPSSIPAPSPSQPSPNEGGSQNATSPPSASPSPSSQASSPPTDAAQPPLKAPTMAPAIAAPAANGPTTTDDGTIPFSGTGTPGNTVTITASPAPAASTFAPASFVRTSFTQRAATGTVVATTVVGQDGTWETTVDLTALGEGSYVLTVTQSNAAGVSPSSSRTVTYQKTPAVPVAPVITPLGPITVTGTTILTGTGSAGDTIAISVAKTNSQQSWTDLGSAIVAADGSWSFTSPSLSNLVNGDYLVRAVQSNSAGSSDPATIMVTVAIPPEAPVVSSVDTGGGLYFPIVSGHASSGATVTVTGGPDGPVTVHANGSGDWITPQIEGFSAGQNSITATQSVEGVTSAPSAPTPFTLTAPSSITANYLSGDANAVRFSLAIQGNPGTQFEALADGDSFLTATLDSSGAYSSDDWQWTGIGAGAHTLSARYASGHRFGPSVSTPFQAPQAFGPLTLGEPPSAPLAPPGVRPYG
jgi:RNA polymerase sigma factor (sigma-70 family)